MAKRRQSVVDEAQQLIDHITQTTQRDIARWAGVSAHTVHSWRKQIRSPSLDALLRFSEQAHRHAKQMAKMAEQLGENARRQAEAMNAAVAGLRRNTEKQVTAMKGFSKGIERHVAAMGAIGKQAEVAGRAMQDAARRVP